MTQKTLLFAMVALIVTVIAGVFYVFSDNQFSYQQAQIAGAINNDAGQETLFPISQLKLREPVAGFKENITKKTFGIFITPETSPVKPDHFTGYHTGVDVEFTESSEEIPVFAIADGIIVAQVKTSGYGGVVVIRHAINGLPVFGLYGHLDPKSFSSSNIPEVKAGDTIGFLGDGYTDETDGARKHLHFSIYLGEEVDFRGYVQTKEELTLWLNPLDLY